jgi:hypothetical protein
LVDNFAALTPDFYRRIIFIILSKKTRYNTFTVMLPTCVFFMVRRQDSSILCVPRKFIIVYLVKDR